MVSVPTKHNTSTTLFNAPTLTILSLLLLLNALAPHTQALEPDLPAFKRWPVEYMSGVLWAVGGGATPLAYTLAPQIITVRCPIVSEWPLAGGKLIYSTRLSLLIEPIIVGPESYFIGTAAAGYLEWYSPARRFSCYFAGGGGFGWMDSKGHEIAGAQGQDFNLNWLLNLGLRIHTRTGLQWTTGVYFQHISNRNLDDINPGLNALGPTVGLSWKF